MSNAGLMCLGYSELPCEKQDGLHTMTLHSPKGARAHAFLFLVLCACVCVCVFSLFVFWICVFVCVVCLFVRLFVCLLCTLLISLRADTWKEHCTVSCIEQQDMSLATTVTTSTGIGPTSLVAEIGKAA